MTTPAEYPDAGRADGMAGPDQPWNNGMDDAPLLVGGSSELMARWQRAQTLFVDEPREAVQEARQLVEDALGLLADTFDRERERLENVWEAGDEPSTEELRQALQRYRTFFDRLLAV